MALIDELIRRLSKQERRHIYLYLVRKELGGTPTPSGAQIGTPTGVGSSWEGPNLEVSWDDPTSEYGAYMDTKIIVYNSHHMQRIRRTDYARGTHYSYTYEDNVADADVLGEDHPSPHVYLEIRHRTEGKVESDPAYLTCDNTVPAAPTISSWDWEEPTLHVEIETSGRDIDYPEARLVKT